jgi:hypothetical protein
MEEGMDRLKKLLGLGAPGGVDDIAVRAAKTAISTFFAVMGADAVGWVNPDLLETALIAAGGAAVSVVQNSILAWANR